MGGDHTYTYDPRKHTKHTNLGGIITPMVNARVIDSRTKDESESIAFTFTRVTPTPAMRKALENSHRDLIAGFPMLASFAGSESVHYHAVNQNTETFPIACTDGAAIYFNVAEGGWFDKTKWSDDNRVFVHAHEVAHVMREDVLWHHAYATLGQVTVPRTPTCPDGRLPYDQDYLEEAHDCIINSGLIADKIGAPLAGLLTHPAITWDTPTGAAYAIIYQKNEDQKNDPKPSPKPKPNPLAGDQRTPGSMGDPDGDESEDASAPQDPAAAAQTLADGAAERAVATKRAISAARQAGQGSSALEAMTKKSREPGVDWRGHIQGFLARAAGNSAYDWRRPSRPPQIRELLGEQSFFAPSRGGHGCNHVTFVGDTSGSIGEHEHQAMLGALCEMMGELNPRTLSVVWCDSELQRIDVFDGTPGADVLEDFYSRNKIPRGGGTCFIPPFDLMDALALGSAHKIPPNTCPDAVATLLDAGKPDGFIYFTDLYGQAPAEQPDYPVLWVCVAPTSKHPWGDRVDVDPQELL